ncbi:MAG: peptidoglycan-binding protein, partial [Candidatus Kerfeldbacteria bacterium]|nr:peptidoglycan-binding protein [Candidatus Kerfeldbacteria bacterium]
MMNFKKSKTAKAVSGFVGLATAIMMMGPVAASADTASDIAAQIAALTAQLNALQGTSATVTTSGHMFNVDLTLGSTGDDVVALQTLLVSKGHLVMPVGVAMGYFGNLTKAAVSAWQAASGISPTAGYFGPKSRAAVNAMGGGTTTTTTTTSTVPGCTSTTGFSPTTGASCAGGTVVVALVPGCTGTTGYSPTTGASCATGGTTVVGGGVSVMLDSSVVTNNLISGQGVATLAGFKISNGGAADLKVTMMKFKRTGISSDSTLNNVYLYQGAARLTDSASVATGIVNFTDTAGLVTVPAGSSVTVLVRADIAGSMNGQNVGLMLTDVTTDGGAVSGLPVSGPQLEISAVPSGMTTADFTGSFSPLTGTVDPQNDYIVWQNSLSIGSRDANLTSFRIQQIGSVYTDDIVNFRLMIDGVQVGAAVTKADANRFVTFMADPAFVVKTGSHVVKVVADIVGGSNRNFQYSLRRVVDIELLDSQFGVVVTPTKAAATFSAIESGNATPTISINAGTLTITKATDSPSGNITLNASGITYAKYTVRANGEKLKVENLRISHTATDGSGTADGRWWEIRNGALFLDGAQIGSTADICEDTTNTNCTVAYTQFNLGSSMILEPGKDYTLEIRGDVYNNGTDAYLASGTTTVANIATGSSNVYRMGSLSYFNNTATVGNTLTVASGSLTLAKYTAYANQTIITPQTAYKIGEWRLTGGSSEGVNLDTLTLTLPETTNNIGATSTDVTNIYVVYGTKTSVTKAAGAASLTWAINEAFPANGTMDIKVYANLATGLASGEYVSGTLVVSGTSATAGTAVTSASAGVAGQTITVGSGTLTVASDASTPILANVVGLSMPKVLSLKYTSSNDAFTLTDIGLTVGSAANAAAISELIFKDGATELKRVAMNSTAATATGLSVLVSKDGTKLIDVYAQLGAVGSGAATTSLNVATSHASTKYLTSAGTSAYKNTAVTGTAQYVFKTKPTITNLTLPTSVLSTGVNTVAKFRIAADAGGTVAWRKLILTVASSTGITTTTAGWGIYDDANQAAVLSGSSAANNMGASTTVVFTSTGDQEIPAGGYKDYVVKATIPATVTLSTGNSFQTNIALGQSAHAAQNPYAGVTGSPTFIWSDESSVAHDDTTADWMGDWLVKNIPTDTQTLTK